jgi:hypothetical protein
MRSTCRAGGAGLWAPVRTSSRAVVWQEPLDCKKRLGISESRISLAGVLETNEGGLMLRKCVL